MNKTGSLLFINFDDLIMKFAKENDLGEYSILIASHEINGSLKVKSAMSGVSTGIRYESKYDNIEFVSSLRPTPQAMEHAYGSTDKSTFIGLYNSHLLSVEPFTDICSIVDMVVNSHCNVLIVVSVYEDAANVLSYLRDFIEDEFLLRGYLYDELERLSSNYENKPLYQKIVASLDFDVPESFDGKDFDCIVSQYGDEEEIKKQLELQKVIAASMAAKPGEENDITAIFFNRFTEDLESKVKEMLLKRDDDSIKDMCRAKEIRIAPKASKEMLVDKLLHAMKLKVARTVEYQLDD